MVEEVNDKHLGPWAEACTKDKVFNTPLSPYIDKELLANKHLHLDGSKLMRTGFKYTVPEVTVEKLEEVRKLIIRNYFNLDLKMATRCMWLINRSPDKLWL